MEFCVLIPKELSLAVKFDSSTDPLLDSFSQRKPSLVVVANARIPKGAQFRPLEGTVRYEKINLFPSFTSPSPSAVSSLHQYYDSTIDKRRHCNWIKFLSFTNELDSSVNLICTNYKGEAVYETIRPIHASGQLVAFYDEDASSESDEVEQKERIVRQQQDIMDQILEFSPIDLSRKLLVSQLSVPFNGLNVNSNLLNTRHHNGGPAGHNIIHRGRHSSSQGTTNPSRNMLPCEVCGKAFDRPSLLRRHMRTHTGEKPHVCDVCGKGFSTSSSLNTHRRIHSGEKPHQCPICGKRFTASSNLYYHRMTHTKDKPHKCSLCGKSFPTPGDLKAHAYIHNGRWPYKCSICNRGFSKQTNLKNHLFLHTGDKPHVCKICDKRFALACNLRAHLKTHQHTINSVKSPSSSSSISSSSPTSSSLSSLSTANTTPVPSAASAAINLLSEDLTSNSSTNSNCNSSSNNLIMSSNNNQNLNVLVDNNSVNCNGNTNNNHNNNNNNLQQFFLMTASLLAMRYGEHQL